MRGKMTLRIIGSLAVSLYLVAAPAAAQTAINQKKALAGGITPGDAPGFPVTISQKGSYKLTSNLTVPDFVDGIVITSHDVTLDLNGYVLNGGGNGRRGIVGALNTAIIKNGIITGFSFRSAIIGADFWTVENVRVVLNGSGVRLGTGARVKGNIISHNAYQPSIDGMGVECSNCLVEGNVITNNGRIGVLASGTVLANTIVKNRKAGIAALAGSVVGFGSNVIAGNNAGGTQVVNAVPLHSNHCSPAC